MMDNYNSMQLSTSDFRAFFKEYANEDENYLLYMLSHEAKIAKTRR